MLSLVQITDLHVRASPGELLRGVDTRESLLTVLRHVRRHHEHLDALLVTGDIADDGSTGAYGFVREALADFPCPLLCTAGNHDEPVEMMRMFASPRFRCAGAVTLGEHWTVELLDSHLPGRVAGELTAVARAQLQAMRASGDDRFRLLAVHHPPIDLGSAWLDASGLREPRSLLDHVDADPRIRAVVWGHAHQCWDSDRDGTRMLGTPATCMQFLPKSPDFAIDEGRPPGYRWLGLHDDGRVETRIIWVAE